MPIMQPEVQNNGHLWLYRIKNTSHKPISTAFRVLTFVSGFRSIQLPTGAHLSSLHSGPKTVCNSVALAAVPDSNSSARCQQRTVPSCTNLMCAIFFPSATHLSVDLSASAAIDKSVLFQLPLWKSSSLKHKYRLLCELNQPGLQILYFNPQYYNYFWWPSVILNKSADILIHFVLCFWTALH